jgi:DNA polymerase-3 subunit gamma/tau
MYQVLARKCRPQTFEELVGQPHVAQTLSNAITNDRLAHAYIFAGLRGTGKTTVARILAKCLNCEKGPTTTPCGECDACIEIAESRAIDVLEVDAASRTKVDQTRELLEVVSYAPVRDRNKILIIDEAHMLSKSSFNALLKTLEEPPPNVVFVLATTELQKILPTILSRCQVFEFRRVGPAEVTPHLRSICDNEQIEIPDAALERLARSGEGSVRDSLSLLERAVALCGDKIGEEDVLRMLGAVRAKVLVDLFTALAARDAAGMLGVLDAIVDEGHDLVHFWSAMISAVRDLLLDRTLPDRKDMLSRPPDEAEELILAGKDLSREDLTRVFQILADLEFGLKSSSQPRFLWEATLIRLAGLGAVRPIEEVLESLGGAAPAPSPPRQKKKHAEASAAAGPVKPRTTVAAPNKPTAPAEQPTPRPKSDSATALPIDATPTEPQSPGTGSPGGVNGLVEAVTQARPLVGAILAQATLVLDAGELLIRIPAGMQAVKGQVESRQSLTLLRDEARRLTGETVEVRVEVAKEEEATAVPPAEPKPQPPASTPEAPVEPAPAKPPPATARPAEPAADGLLDQARDEPGVRKLMDAFGAQVVKIRRHDESTKTTRTDAPTRQPEDAP